MKPVETWSIFCIWSGIIFRQGLCRIWIMDLFLWWWLWTTRVMNLNTTEISVLGTFHAQFIQHTLIVNRLSLSTTVTDSILDEIELIKHSTYYLKFASWLLWSKQWVYCSNSPLHVFFSFRRNSNAQLVKALPSSKHFRGSPNSVLHNKNSYEKSKQTNVSPYSRLLMII